jgi:hypothetical protein
MLGHELIPEAQGPHPSFTSGGKTVVSQRRGGVPGSATDALGHWLAVLRAVRGMPCRYGGVAKYIAMRAGRSSDRVLLKTFKIQL